MADEYCLASATKRWSPSPVFRGFAYRKRLPIISTYLIAAKQVRNACVGLMGPADLDGGVNAHPNQPSGTMIDGFSCSLMSNQDPPNILNNS
jgi:hypothetical protein